MKAKNILLSALMIGGLAELSLSAQETQRVYNLEECVSVAMASNSAMAAARAASAAAGDTEGASKAAYYPWLSATADYGRWQRLAFLPSGIPLPADASDLIGPTDDMSYGVNARWTIWDSGARSGAYRSSSARARAMTQFEQQMMQDVVMSVHAAFYELVAAKQARNVAQETMARSTNHLELARNRIKAGASVKADESRAQVEVSNGKLGVLRADSRFRIACGNLNTAMGLPAEREVDVAALEDVPRAPVEFEIDDVMSEAITTRPDLLAASAMVEAARSDLAAAKSSRGPRITAQGSYDRREGDFAGPENEWLVGVSAELPLFKGFETIHNVSAKRSALLQAEALYLREVSVVKQEVWSSYSRRMESYQAVEATATQVADAEESLRLAGERYKAGAATMSELLDAQAALSRAEGTQIDARRDYHIADAAFKRSVGALTDGK